MQDDEAASEEFPKLDALPGPAAPAGPGWELHRAQPEAHGVVGGDAAAIAAAELESEVTGRPPPSRLGPRRRPSEASVVVREEDRQEGIGVLGRGDATQAQLTNEAILQGLPEAFDAPFGRGRAGGDEGNAQTLEHLPEVCGVLGSAQLFLEGPVRVVAEEDIEAVAVESRGPAAGPILPGPAPVLGRPRARRHRCRVARLTASPSTSWSFSVA